jgi:hypothetical protein
MLADRSGGRLRSFGLGLGQVEELHLDGVDLPD